MKRCLKMYVHVHITYNNNNNKSEKNIPASDGWWPSVGE